MDIEDIALKYHNFNGMKLVDFSEVALPIYRVTSIAIVQEKVDLPTIEEFVLRSVHLGFKSISEIHGLLGISEAITRGALSSLIQADLIYETSNGSVALSKEGINSAKEYSKIRPSEKQVVFDYDGLVRKVRLTIGEVYLSPKEVKEQGLIEIRAIPARRPTEEEISLQDVSRFLSKYTSVEESNKTLLRIRDITRAVRLFYKAVMLIYKDKEGERYEAAFYIEDGISEAHGLAFIKSDGLNRLGLLKEIHTCSKKELEVQYPKYIFDDVNNRPRKKIKIQPKGKRKILSLKNHLAKKREAAIDNPVNSSVNHFQKIRTLPVYEHPKVLLEALREAKKTLVIISPWITRAVVNRKFVDKLESLLKNDVEVKIGFGIGDDDRYDSYAQSLLNVLEDRYDNFTLKNLGDTHAKILIKDNDFYVITSFNWLSFKGDSKKKFREEWGNYVEGPELVRDFYGEINSRFHE